MYKKLWLLSALAFFTSVYAEETKAFPRTFDHIIPLGDNCQTNLQLQFLGLREANVGLEWIISESAADIASLIINDWAGFLERDNFMLITGDAVNKIKYECDSYIWDRRYNLRITHDFPVKPDFLHFFDVFHTKFTRLIKRFKDRLTTAEQEGKSILFMRRCASKGDAQLLAYAIATRYPNLDFTLFVVDATEEIKEDWNLPHIINRYLDVATGLAYSTPDVNAKYKPVIGSVIDLTKMGKDTNQSEVMAYIAASTKEDLEPDKMA